MGSSSLGAQRRQRIGLHNVPYRDGSRPGLADRLADHFFVKALSLTAETQLKIGIKRLETKKFSFESAFVDEF